MVFEHSLLPLLLVGVGALLAFFLDLHPRLTRLGPWWGVLVAVGAAILVFRARLHLGAGFYWDSSASILGVYLTLATALVFIFWAQHPLARHLAGGLVGLSLLVLLGALILVSSQNLLGLLVGLELQVLPFFALLVWPGSRRLALEAGIKYALLAALASALFGLGVALLFLGNGSLALIPPSGNLLGGFAGHLGLLLLYGALGFELAVAPFHAWVADVYEGAPAPILLLLGAVAKVGIMGAFISLASVSENWTLPLLVLAVLSMLVGNFLALRATKIRRLLGYSAVAHAGYFLAALSAGPLGLIAATFYAITYGIQHLGAFLPIVILPEETQKIPWTVLRQRQPLLAGLLAIALLSLAGMPPTLGFFAKLAVLLADIHAGLWSLAVIVAGLSALSFAYYLSVLWQKDSSPRPPALLGARSWSTLAALGIFLLLLGWLGLPLFFF